MHLQKDEIEKLERTYKLNLINSLSESFIEKAHFTSAKLERGESEFDRMKLEKEFIAGFHAPFVKDSPVKIGMKHLESIPLPNGCLFVIGSVEMLVLPDEAINDLGQLDLQHSSSIGISGLK